MDVSIIDKFLENSFVPIYGIAFVISLFKYSKYYHTPLKFVPILLLYTFLNELLGGLILRNPEFSLFNGNFYSHYTFMIYNIYTIIFYSYFYYLYWHYLKNKKQKKYILYGAFFHGTIVLINPFFHDFLLESQVYSYIVGGIILIISTIFYLQNQSKISKFIFIKTDLLSWISTGLLVFYLGYLPIKILRFYNATHVVIRESPNIRRLHLALILIMYICFIIGFMKMRRMKSVREEN